MTIKYLALAAAVSLSLGAGAAQAKDVVVNNDVGPGVNQDRFDVGFRFAIKQGEAREIVPGDAGATSDAVLCNLSSAQGSFAFSGMKHNIDAGTCLPLYGIKSLHISSDQSPAWNGTVFIRAHAD